VQAIKGIPREKVQVATKFGYVVSEDGQLGLRGDPEWVREACEGSLKRLGVDYIDLYYQHRLDSTVPIEITVCNMQLPVPLDPSFLAQFSIQEIQLPGQVKQRCR
jgi:aryl-alcohol dehydrogenase-like predicted oxidoreductase